MRDARVDEGRAAPAGRVRLPVWFLVLFGVVELALLGAPLLARPVPAVAAVAWLPVVAFALVHDRLLGLAIGVPLSRRALRAYPSARPASTALVMVTAVGALMITALMHARIDATAGATAAVAVAALTTALAVRCLVRQADGIRRDLDPSGGAA